MPRQKKVTKKKLNEKEITFCHLYLVYKWNGTKAFMKAFGRKDERAAAAEASRLLTNANVRRLVKKLTDEHLATLGYNSLDVLKEIAKMAFSDIRNYASWNQKDGVIIKDSDQLGELGSAIKEIEIDTTEEEIEGEKTGLIAHKIKVKLHSKSKHLKMLGENLALFTKILEVKASDADTKLKRIADLMDERSRHGGDRSNNGTAN